MTRLFMLLALVSAAFTYTSAQAYNTVLRDQLDYTQDVNDIWGYVAPDSTEYALVGTATGLSIVSLANPDSIYEVAFIPGDQSIWRDMKTYGQYSYTVTDTGDDGLLIVDMSNLPESVSHEYVNVGIDGSNETLQTAHNIYIDETTGIAYISGGNYNQGGMVLYDVATTPGEAIYINKAPSIYSHDVYVQDGLMYASEINNGRLAIYNVSDPMNITLLGTRNTPYNFTHNAWTESSGNYIFTTDERGNAPTASYDISDPANPVLLDEFRPSRSVGSGVIPHNAHVLNDYLVISHYTDGLEIVDASNPSNLVEVGYYDTWTGADGGFNGCWGAYPFLPSGLVLATDISTGLYVVEVDYKRASFLAGTVTDIDGNALNNVTVTVASAESSVANTDAAGAYNTGVVGAGVVDVTFSLQGYTTQTQSVELLAGQSVTLDVQLESLQSTALAGQVTNAVNGNSVADAQVVLVGQDGTFNATTDANGNVNVENIFLGDYQVYVAKWGFKEGNTSVTVANGSSFSLQLEPGYQDGFILDQGWTTDNGSATAGHWVREKPFGTQAGGGTPSNPGADAEGDLGDIAYVTGNSTDAGVGTDDIDGGVVTLTSPVIDFAILPDSNIRIKYDYWFFNGGGDGNPLDRMVVQIDNGVDVFDVKTYSVGNDAVMSAWVSDSIDLLNTGITVTENMRLVISIGDTGEGHLVEGGLDKFEITSLAVSNTENVALAGLTVDVFPNPTADLFTVNYQLPSTAGKASIEVVDLQGRQIANHALSNGRQGRITLGQQLPAGSYFLRLHADGEVAYTTKVVKQ